VVTDTTIAITCAVVVAILVIAVVVWLGLRWSSPQPIDIARGKYLDMLGQNVGVTRKRWETDVRYRARINETLRRFR
jgi:hypothetical protein